MNASRPGFGFALLLFSCLSYLQVVAAEEGRRSHHLHPHHLLLPPRQVRRKLRHSRPRRPPQSVRRSHSVFRLRVTARCPMRGVSMARLSPAPLLGSFALTAAATSDAGSYDVVVTNSLNGTTATATSSAAALSVVTEPTAFTISSEDAVLPDNAQHGASVEAQAGVTYSWTVVNGTIVNGQEDPRSPTRRDVWAGRP